MQSARATSGCDAASMARRVSGRLAVTLCSLICLLRERSQRRVRRGRKHPSGLWPHSSPAEAGAVGGLLLQIPGFGFTEEEKDDGLTMSVVSGEGMKSPPNGDRVEAQAAQTDRPPKPGESSDLSEAGQTPFLGGTQCLCVSGGDGGDSTEGLGHASTGKVAAGHFSVPYSCRQRQRQPSHTHPTEGAASRLHAGSSSISWAKTHTSKPATPAKTQQFSCYVLSPLPFSSVTFFKNCHCFCNQSSSGHHQQEPIC